MRKIENHCQNCAVPGYPCLGNSCPNRHVVVHFCDDCGEEMWDIYDVNGEELCEDCLKKRFWREDDDDDSYL